MVIQRTPPVLRCSGCGQLCFDHYDRYRQRLRDLNVFDLLTYLILDKWRVRYPSCGVRVEDLGFACPYARATQRFEELVASLSQLMPVANVAELLGVDGKTVKEIDKRALQREFAHPDYANLRLLAIDELSYKKRHKYLTLVLDFEHTRVVWVGIGRKQATLETFFDEIGDEIACRIEAIALDMWDSYLAALKARAPQAEPFFDKFLVIRNYSKVIDKVRLEEFRKAAGDDREVLKGTKYLLLKDRENLTEEPGLHLKRLLELNRNLNVVYLLKDDLYRPGTGKRLWDCRDHREAMSLLGDWIQTAEESAIKGLQEFAGTLSCYWYGLLNHCDYPINIGRLEGLNNKIKVIKRRCYGFHDLEYFALKIKQASVLNLPP